jgi:hypothetical protein
MNSRRKFLLNSSLASLSFIVAKPYKAMSNGLQKIPGFTLEPNTLSLLVTRNFSGDNLSIYQDHARSFKTNFQNSLLIHPGNHTGYQEEHTSFDVSFNSIVSTGKNYSIIRKGNIKIGMIAVKSSEIDVANKVNTLAAFLKDEKACHLVICLSQLGYKNKNSMDDIQLAKESVGVDIILGGNDANACHHPMVRLNRNSHEVMMQSSCGHKVAVGKIDLQFNDEGKKQFAYMQNLPASNN